MRNADWASIGRFTELEAGRLVGRRRDPFFTSTVKKRDEANRLIWVDELGDQPIPLVGFDFEVTYHDESPRGTSGGGSYKVYTKTATVKVKVPAVGQKVLVCREMNYDGLPRCLGVILSKNYIQDLEDI